MRNGCHENNISIKDGTSLVRILLHTRTTMRTWSRHYQSVITLELINFVHFINSFKRERQIAPLYYYLLRNATSHGILVTESGAYARIDQSNITLTLKRPAGVLWDSSIAWACATLDLPDICSRYFMNLSPNYRSMFMSAESRFIF